MGASRTVRLGFVLCTAVVLVVASTFAASAGPIKKQYTADVSPHTVNSGSTVEYTVKVTDKALTQSLGSCNVTAPTGFSIGAVTQQPQPAPGVATKNGNTVELRSMSIAPTMWRTVKFTATAPTPANPPVNYAWVVICRQANNFSPQTPSNEFTMDAANSNLVTTVQAPPPPLPDADIAVTGNAESQDPITASNTVIYFVTVHNSGPATSGPITLTDSVPDGGSITSIDGGPNWTCSGSGASSTCTHAALALNTDAETVTVNVLTPDADTVITNRASVSQTDANDPVPSNNTLDQTTTVNANTTCAEGQLNCGSGTINYSQPSQVQSCVTPTMANFTCVRVNMNATSSSGTATYNVYTFENPEPVCPLNLDAGRNVLVNCDYEAFIDNIPAQQSVGGTVAVVSCDQSKCPVGLGDTGTIIVYIGQSGQSELLPKCSGPGDTRKCWEKTRIGGDLVITVRNMPPGDPKIAGRCLAGC